MVARASLVPSQPGASAGPVYLVVDDFGRLGRAWREIDEECTREADIVHMIVTNEFHRPVKVTAFDVEEGWARDVTEDVARAVLAEAQRRGTQLHGGALDFVERAINEPIPPSLLDA
jgi:hypothetical protein